MASPIVFSYEFTTRAPIDAAWREVSDTDRFNRAIGTGFHFERQPDGRTRGIFSKLGCSRCAGGRYPSPAARPVVHIGAFSRGPPSVVARCDLRPQGGRLRRGTQIVYRVEATPRA
ncbi:MAG: hypothetical protein U0414_39400 [Polyangiaceae bacterium]